MWGRDRREREGVWKKWNEKFERDLAMSERQNLRDTAGG